MSQIRYSPGLLVAILLVIFFGVALYLRVALPYDKVFTGEWVKFTSLDAYYHMRLVDNLVYNFPHRISFDPYVHYPYGGSWPSMPLFDWLLAGIIWLVSLGSPSQHIVDVVGVYFPAVLGALTVIPVYFIGKELFNRWAGVLSAALIALLPGEFLGRSALGFTDHHIAEVLFSATAMLFLILAVKSAKQRGLSFAELRHLRRATLVKPLTYSLLAGLFLGIYMLAWIGGFLFVFIVLVYLVTQSFMDHLRGRDTGYLGIVGTICLLVASVMALPFLPAHATGRIYTVGLPVAVVTPLVLTGVSRLLMGKKIRLAYYPLVIAGLGMAGGTVFYFVAPSLLEFIGAIFSGIFNPSGFGLTVQEVRPLLSSEGHFSLVAAWGNYTTGFFLSLISLGILVYHCVKRGEADKTLFIVWSLVILATALGQRRFAYYFAINVALLTGYLSWRILELAGINRLRAKSIETLQTAGKKKGRSVKARQATGLSSRVIPLLAFVVIFFLVFFPNIRPAVATAKAALMAPPDAWYESLSWLKENSPEPFGDPGFYYETYQPPPPRGKYEYPESAYGVMARWDVGHWITRVAQRPTNNDPGTSWSPDVARCLIAPDEASAIEIMDKLDSKYVILDYQTSMTKLFSIATLAGSSEEELYDIYYLPKREKLVPQLLFHPQYYRSFCVRLYNFEGEAVAAEKPLVISYQEKVNEEGELYREITDYQFFSSYESAQDYVLGQESGNYMIVGTSPFISPVPLEALQNFKLIYSSENSIWQSEVGVVPEVKIFEYNND